MTAAPGRPVSGGSLDEMVAMFHDAAAHVYRPFVYQSFPIL